MTEHDRQAPAAAEPPLLQVTDLARSYRLPRRSLWRAPEQVHALRGVDFTLTAGRSLGVVGESGSGKSTLARLVMALDTPSAGSVQLLGQDLHRLGNQALRMARRDFQMVFQDPYGSLDPRMTVEHIVCEPLTALVTRPRLIVADEPVSALDVSVQAQVLNLLRDLQQQLGLSYLFISHDLAVVQHLCDDAIVLSEGRIVERGAPQQLFHAPQHPYTQALVRAVPRIALQHRA